MNLPIIDRQPNVPGRATTRLNMKVIPCRRHRLLRSAQEVEFLRYIRAQRKFAAGTYVRQQRWVRKYKYTNMCEQYSQCDMYDEYCSVRPASYTINVLSQKSACLQLER